MSKHTKGPWEVKETFLQDFQIWSVSGECVAVDVISRENTQLIAAAPDMLEALQNIENDDEHMPDSAWQLIQDAITKATGENNGK